MAPRVAAQPPTSAVALTSSTLLREIKAADTDQLAVSEEDGRFLRVMAASSGAKHALEIGAANGYSAIWIGLGLRQTGGHLTTIEYDAARAKAPPTTSAAPASPTSSRSCRATRSRKSRSSPATFDFVFLDAWKRDYKRFFDLVFPRLRPRGLFLAHNVVNKRGEMRDFLGTIQNNPRSSRPSSRRRAKACRSR